MTYMNDAIRTLKQRIRQLEGDKLAALDAEMHSRIRGDDALIGAYKLAVAHLEMVERNKPVRNPFKWVARTLREAKRRLRPII